MNPILATYNALVAEAQSDIALLELLLVNTGQSPQVQVLLNTSRDYLAQLQANAPTV